MRRYTRRNHDIVVLFFLYDIYTTLAVISKNETYPNRDTYSDTQCLQISFAQTQDAEVCSANSYIY